MTVSRLFSKWPEATVLPDKIAEGVAEFSLNVLLGMDVANSRSMTKAENSITMYDIAINT
jgi:hypothetical protein